MKRTLIKTLNGLTAILVTSTAMAGCSASQTSENTVTMTYSTTLSEESGETPGASASESLSNGTGGPRDRDRHI